MKRILVTVSGEYEDIGWVALNQIGDAVLLTDDSGEIKFVSPSVESMLGYTSAELCALGRISALFGSDVLDRAELDELGEVRDIERVVTTKSGDERHLLIHVKTVSIKDCTRLYTCRDITERRRAQQALHEARLAFAHASRLALAGHLIASISHEVNQPLTSIVSNADAAFLALDGEITSDSRTELRATLNDIHEEGQRAADVVRRLRALVHRQPIDRQSLDLRQFVEDALRLIRGELRRCRVAVRNELDSSLPRIEADPVSLQQVLLNIVINSLEAMEDVNQGQRELDIRARRIGDLVEVSIGDNGHGLEADDPAKVFEPFFTTKAEGLGLGLAIAKSIVEEHGGSIYAEAGANCGATFRIRLPIQV